MDSTPHRDAATTKGRANPSITVAICTYNRSRLLRQTLETIAELEVPQDLSWEVLVVDNNSTDDTQALAAEFAQHLPLRIVFEAEPGKSNAANAAVQAASGDVIIWTDDDVMVPPDWLVRYHEAFREYPDAGIFGGPIEPHFEGTPPRWLERGFALVDNAYATLDLGDVAIPLGHDAYPYGANMALRRQLHVQEPFDTNLGPNPKTLVRGEEMVVVRRLLQAGEKGRWVPGARVRHVIPRDRQTIRYLRRYYLGSGQLLDYLQEPHGPGFLGRPLWLWRQAIEGEIKYRFLRVFGKPERWIREFILASVAWGQLRGYRPRSFGV